MQQKELFAISDDSELALMQSMACSSDMRMWVVVFRSHWGHVCPIDARYTMIGHPVFQRQQPRARCVCATGSLRRAR